MGLNIKNEASQRGTSEILLTKQYEMLRKDNVWQDKGYLTKAIRYQRGSGGLELSFFDRHAHGTKTFQDGISAKQPFGSTNRDAPKTGTSPGYYKGKVEPFQFLKRFQVPISEFANAFNTKNQTETAKRDPQLRNYITDNFDTFRGSAEHGLLYGKAGLFDIKLSSNTNLSTTENTDFEIGTIKELRLKVDRSSTSAKLMDYIKGMKITAIVTIGGAKVKLGSFYVMDAVVDDIESGSTAWADHEIKLLEIDPSDFDSTLSGTGYNRLGKGVVSSTSISASNYGLLGAMEILRTADASATITFHDEGFVEGTNIIAPISINDICGDKTNTLYGVSPDEQTRFRPTIYEKSGTLVPNTIISAMNVYKARARFEGMPMLLISERAKSTLLRAVNMLTQGFTTQPHANLVKYGHGDVKIMSTGSESFAYMSHPFLKERDIFILSPFGKDDTWSIYGDFQLEENLFTQKEMTEKDRASQPTSLWLSQDKLALFTNWQYSANLICRDRCSQGVIKGFSFSE